MSSTELSKLSAEELVRLGNLAKHEPSRVATFITQDGRHCCVTLRSITHELAQKLAYMEK